MHPDAFHRQNPLRRSAIAVGYGLSWVDDARPGAWTVRWLVDTNELVAERHHPIAGAVCEVEVLAVLATRRDVDSALDGWEGVCGRYDSLGRLRRRLQSYQQPGRPAW